MSKRAREPDLYVRQCSDESDVKCVSCDGFVNEPKLLKCLHYVCKRCITDDVSLTGKVKCKSCGDETDVPASDVDRLPTAGFIEQIKEAHESLAQAKRLSTTCYECSKSPATAFCNRCRFICEKCLGNHKQMKTFKDHAVLDNYKDYDSIPDNYIPCVSTPRYCKEHKEKLVYFCCTCEHLICRDCYIVGKHKGHTTKGISEKREENFSSLEEQLRLLKETLSQLQDGMMEIDSAKQSVDSDVAQKQNDLKTLFSDAAKVLQETHTELSEKLTNTAEEMKSALDTQLRHLKNCQLEIERVLRVIKRCLGGESDIDIVDCHKAMLGKADQLRAFCDTQNTKPEFPVNVYTEVHAQLKDSLKKLLEENVKVTAPKADASKSKIETVDTCSDEVSFVLTTVYENGQPCVTAQKIEANVNTPNGTSTAVVKPLSSSTYNLLYTPLQRGKHALSVLVNNQKVQCSPVEFTVSSPTKIANKASFRLRNLSQPYQIAFTTRNELLVMESSMDGRVLKTTVNADGEIEKSRVEFRKNFNQSGYRPQGIATAADGSVFILYDGEFKIVKYDQDGTFVKEVEYDSELLKRPGRVKFNEDQKVLYVCDRGNRSFQVFDSQLNVRQSFSKGQLYADVAFGDKGVMYLSDKEGNCVCIFNREGEKVGQIGEHGQLHSPRGLLYQDDYLFVADRNNKRIAVFETITGNYKLVHHFTDKGFSDPGSIASDKDKKIYVCDERSGQVFVFH